MSLLFLLWIVWAAATALMFLLIAYRGTLTRYEEDQIFLDPASGHQEEEQLQIVRRVNRIQPFIRAATGAACALSATIVGMYVWDAVSRFR